MKLNNVITDRQIIVELVNDFLGKEYDDYTINLLISKSLCFFSETGFYPNNADLHLMLYKLEMEALDKRL